MNTIPTSPSGNGGICIVTCPSPLESLAIPTQLFGGRTAAAACTGTLKLNAKFSPTAIANEQISNLLFLTRSQFIRNFSFPLLGVQALFYPLTQHIRQQWRAVACQ